MIRIIAGALFVAIVVLAFEAGRASASRWAPVIPAVAVAVHEPDRGSIEAPRRIRPSAAPAKLRTRRLVGIASWGRGWGNGVVTRLPRGTRICITSSDGRWCGRSTGFGPARWTHRVADLSPAVFQQLCGPLSLGLCRVSVTW